MISAIIPLLLAIPAGFLIAWLARDELLAGRKWFKNMIIGSLVLALAAFAIGLKAEAAALLFLSILAFISYVKSFDRNWTQRNI